MSHREEKKQKKLAQLLKNRKAGIAMQADALARERDLDAEREEEMKAAAQASSRQAERSKANGQPVWSAKMQMIRNKIDGRERMAKERWNRFAGTAESGGRGL